MHIFQLKGPLSIGVPGEIKGFWEAHQKYGKLPWFSLFEPIIELCEKGFPLTERNYKIMNDLMVKENEIPYINTLKDIFVDEDTGKYKYVSLNCSQKSHFL